jgi:hypothetical protein
VAVALDNRALGTPFDAYAAEVWSPERAECGEIDLPAGKHRLRFTAVGRNPRSAGFDMGIDCIQLRPADSAHPGAPPVTSP